MGYLGQTKDFPGIADVFLRDPGRYAPLLQFIESVMVGPSELTKAERELIAAHVSQQNGCAFCVGAHGWTLAAMDIDMALIESVERGPDDEAIDDRLRPVLRFAAKLTRTPDEVGPADIERLRRAGWSDQAIEDAINVAGLFNLVNRLVEAHGIRGSEDYFKQIGANLARQGYAPLVRTALKKTRQIPPGQIPHGQNSHDRVPH